MARHNQLKGSPAQGRFLRLLGQLHNPISQEDLPTSLEGHPDLPVIIERLEKGRPIERHRALAVVASRSGLRTSVACRILKQCRSSYVRSVRRFEDGGAERLFAPRINPHRSVELERLTAEGITLIERRNCLEVFRDQAIERFETHTGSSWRPRSG